MVGKWWRKKTMVESRIQKCVFMLVKFEFCKNMGLLICCLDYHWLLGAHLICWHLSSFLKVLAEEKKLHTSNLHIIITFLLFSVILIYHWFSGNVKWQEGRVSGTVYCGSKELTDLLTKVFLGLEVQWYFTGKMLSNLFNCQYPFENV